MTYCDISRFRIKVTAKHEFKWYVCVTGVDVDVYNYDKKKHIPDECLSESLLYV